MVYNFQVEGTHSYFVATPDGCTTWVHNTNAEKVPDAGSGRGRNHLKPAPNAEGAHSTFKRDPVSGKVTGHAEWKPNPQNPKGFDLVKRVDTQYAPNTPHTNKSTGQDVQIPHVHEKGIPGGVRPATPDELPQ